MVRRCSVVLVCLVLSFLAQAQETNPPQPVSPAQPESPSPPAPTPQPAAPAQPAPLSPPAPAPPPAYPPAEVYQPRFKGDPARSQSEARALGYMRTVLDAQRKYFKKNAKYAKTLADLVGSGSFTRRMIKPDRGDYTVSFQKGSESRPGFQLQMLPKQFDAMHRAFWVNEIGMIRAEDDKPATQESPVLRAS